MSNSPDNQEKKKKRGASPVIISRELSQWIKDSGINPKVNNWKVSGGHSYMDKR